MPWKTDEDVAKHKAGLISKQAAQWRRIANSILKREMAKGKSEKEAAASAIKQANGVVNNTNASSLYGVYKTKQTDYEPKLVTHQEKAHIVIPVVMMVEGVHNGSQGPLLHTINELGKFPASWDGRPVVIYHPEIDGEPVSANSPDIIDTQTVGRVYNTTVDGKKLKAEVWLDEDKLNSISEDTLNNVNSSKEMEVSLGMFTENEMEEGEYEGEKYAGIAHNHRPDHLAILPDQIGACSREKGCGLGVNEKDVDEKSLQITVLKDVLQSGYRFSRIGDYKKKGYQEIIRMAYDALRAMDKSDNYHYLEEIYDDSLIYTASMKGESKMYKQDYQIASGVVELTGNPVEVHRKVEYVNNSNNFKKEDKKMAKANDCPKCLEKINALIANEQSKFVEADREFLLTLEEAQLDKLAPVIVEKEKIVEKTVEVNKLSLEDQADLAYAKKQRLEKRNAMIKKIQDNSEQGTWTDAELTAMKDEVLVKVAGLIKDEAPTDYTLNGGGDFSAQSVSGEEPLFPTGVEIETKK